MKFFNAALCVAAALSIGSFAGCETKEKIIDVETPAGNIEVHETTDSGAIEVEADGE